MGRGPEHLLENGLTEVLKTDRRKIQPVTITKDSALPVEVEHAFELDRMVSEEVRSAVGGGEFPLVLSGNCNTSAGTISGLSGSGGLGVVWFDAHPDFNTPDTTTTGFSDSMGLAISVGHCWPAMAGNIPGFTPIPEKNVVTVGTREGGSAEKERLYSSSITVVGPETADQESWLEALGLALDALGGQVDRVYVHLDLDVLDAEKVGRPNESAVTGGLTHEELQVAASAVRDRFEVAALGIASYDPTFDTDGVVLRAGLAATETLVGHHPAV